MKTEILRDGPGVAFNITARVNWAVWHLDPEANSRSFLAILDRCAQQFGFSLVGYVLMANHYHVLAQSPPDPAYTELTTRQTRCRHRRPYPPGHLKASALRQFMHQLMWRASRRIQRELGVQGHFWEGSYRASRIEDLEHLIVALTYDHLNPVVQHIVTKAEDYARSSAAWWAGQEPPAVDLLRHPLPFGITADRLRVMLHGVQECSDVPAILGRFQDRGADLHTKEDRRLFWKELRDAGGSPVARLRTPDPQSDGLTHCR